MQTMRMCPECGAKSFSSTSKTNIKSPAQTSFSSPNPHGIIYAGFWERGAAYLIDICIVYVFTFTFGFFAGMTIKSYGMYHSTSGAFGFLLLIDLLAPITYLVICESGKNSATVGKNIMGIKVLTANLNKISVPQAIGRNLGRLVSTILICAGYFIQPFTANKQTLHDMIAGTVVVKDGSKQHSDFAIFCIFIASFITFCVILTIIKLIK